ncbi:MAG TPA: ATP synthase F1 subunit delta [Kiritimatiellia bacterium]
MANTQVGKRYAKALFQLAQEQGRLDAIHTDLGELAKLLETSVEFKALTRPYAISVTHRKELYASALEGRVDPLILRFLQFIVEKGRAQHLAAMIDSFNQQFNAARNILAVRIVSAHPLEQRQVDEISVRLQARFHKEIKATAEVDPSLLGGFQVRVGDMVYDYSINHQLNQFHRMLITV